METHAHHLHKAPGKNFWHYFYEFLMLFLAVFCGFLAENFREHQVEKERARQYARSFYEDVKADIARMEFVIAQDNEKITVLNSMRACYDTVSKNWRETSCMGMLVKYSKVNRVFAINDRTVSQLANAGGFRLLSKDDADSILSYVRLFKQYQDFESTVFQGTQDNVRNTLNVLANFKVNSELQAAMPFQGTDTSSTIVQGPLLFADDKALLNKWFNELLLYLRVTTAQRNILTSLKTKALGLVEYYKNKYRLE
jgi:hypothetical protein